MSDRTFGGILTFGIAFVLVTLIGGAIGAGNGRNAENHTGSIPAGVTKITSSAYLLDRDATTVPSNICKGGKGDSNKSPIKNTVPVPNMTNKLFVECQTGQTWNDPRPKALNFGHAILQSIWLTPWFMIGAPLLLLVCMLPAISEGMQRHRKSKRLAKEQAAQEAEKQQQLKAQKDVKSAALGTAYAFGNITEQQYEEALDKLYGIPQTTTNRTLNRTVSRP